MNDPRTIAITNLQHAIRGTNPTTNKPKPTPPPTPNPNPDPDTDTDPDPDTDTDTGRNTRRNTRPTKPAN